MLLYNMMIEDLHYFHENSYHLKFLHMNGT